MRKLMAVPLTAFSLAVAAGAAWLFYAAASDYGTSLLSVKVNCVFWFAVALLSVIAGISTASPVALTASALGFVSFATICILDPDAPAAMPQLIFAIEIAAPAFFIFAWFIVMIAAFSNPYAPVRRWAWVWLTLALTVLFVFPSYNYGRFRLHRLRSQHLQVASANTFRIVEQLAAWRQANGAYPAALDAAGIDSALLQLPYRDQKIKYFAGPGMYILTFEDPLRSGAVVYSWDTSRGGWYPADPRDTLDPTPHNLFLGALHPR